MAESMPNGRMDFEADRRERIQRNNRMLEELGLLKVISQIQQPLFACCRPTIPWHNGYVDESI